MELPPLRERNADKVFLARILLSFSVKRVYKARGRGQMLLAFAQSIEAAGEMLQRLCCAAILGSPAVALIEDSVDEALLRQVQQESVEEMH